MLESPVQQRPCARPPFSLETPHRCALSQVQDSWEQVHPPLIQEVPTTFHPLPWPQGKASAAPAHCNQQDLLKAHWRARQPPPPVYSWHSHEQRFFFFFFSSQSTLVPFSNGRGEKKIKHRKIQSKNPNDEKANSVSQKTQTTQWCLGTVVCLMFIPTAHWGFSCPESQSQAEWEEGSAASVHLWVLEDGLLWRLEGRVWEHHLQTPGLLKVCTPTARHFIWHFEQILRLSVFLTKPCVSLCLKNDLTMHLCEWYNWGDLRWCGK